MNTEKNKSERKDYECQTTTKRCILFGEKPFITPEYSIKNAKLIDRVLAEIGY